MTNGVEKSAGSFVLWFQYHKVAFWILLAYLFIAIIYSLVIPIWESYDEPGHYLYARFIADNASLPQEDDPAAEAITEKIQPPLYYLMGGFLLRLMNLNSYTEPVLNPYFTSGNAGINYAIHSDAERMPYQGIALAVHLLRLLSVVIGAVAVWCTYQIGLEIAPGRRLALLAMGLHAFWPQFLFNSSTISNDVLACTVGSLTTWCLVAIIKQGPSILRILALGVLLGLALVTKFNNLVLVPFAAIILVVAIISKLRGSFGRKLLVFLGIFGAAAILVLVWRIVNRMSAVRLPWPLEFGLTRERLVKILTRLGAFLTLANIWQAFLYMVRTLYASFGWGNVQIANIMYYFAWGFQGFTILGGLVALFNRQFGIQKSALLVCLLNLVIYAGEAVLLAVYFGSPYSAHGRYLLPGFSAYIVFLAAGLVSIGRMAASATLRYRHMTAFIDKYNIGIKAMRAGGAAILCIALAIPFLTIQPAYAKPKLSAGTPEYPLYVRFNGQAELLGYDIEGLQPGQPVRVTLYWRCLSQLKENYSVVIQLLDADGNNVGEITSYPGRGNYATSLWEPGQVFQDEYTIRLANNYPPQAYAQLKIMMFGKNTADLVPIYNNNNEYIGHVLVTGQFRVNTENRSLPAANSREAMFFGDYFKLLGDTLPEELIPGSTAEFIFYWESVKPTDQNYTVFVQLLDADGHIVAQGDSQPREGRFPTSLWTVGDTVEDRHLVEIPASLAPGIYKLQVGFYQLSTMARLPAYDETGQRLQNDSVTFEGLAIKKQAQP